MNEQNKVWSPDQVQQLGDYYNIFIEKQHFTIVQTKDLGKFLRKIYGRLQQYEIERGLFLKFLQLYKTPNFRK